MDGIHLEQTQNQVTDTTCRNIPCVEIGICSRNKDIVTQVTSAWGDSRRHWTIKYMNDGKYTVVDCPPWLERLQKNVAGVLLEENPSCIEDELTICAGLSSICSGSQHTIKTLLRYEWVVLMYCPPGLASLRPCVVERKK